MQPEKLAICHWEGSGTSMLSSSVWDALCVHLQGGRKSHVYYESFCNFYWGHEMPCFSPSGSICRLPPLGIILVITAPSTREGLSFHCTCGIARLSHWTAYSGSIQDYQGNCKQFLLSKKETFLWSQFSGSWNFLSGHIYYQLTFYFLWRSNPGPQEC